MSEHHFGSHSIAAVVFLALYLVLTLPVAWLIFTKRVNWLSRWLILFVHCLLRLASQGVALAFGIVSFDNTDLLIAYLVLGVEGYFSLVLVGTYALVDWEVAFLGDSWIEPRHDPPIAWWRRLLVPGRAGGGYLPIGHNLLIAANALCVTCGSLMRSGMNSDDKDDMKEVSLGPTLRCTGAALLLAVAQCYSLACFIDLFKRPTSVYIVLCAATWPFLSVRGAFGIMQIYLPSYNYLSMDTYTFEGLSQRFLLAEYLLGVTMEWICCALFVSLHWCHLPAVEISPPDQMELMAPYAKVHGEERDSR